MIDLYSPRGEMELLILRSILEDAGIPFFVRNDTFGSLYQGRYSEAYNRKTLCVPEAAAHEARELVREFLERTGGGMPPEGPREPLPGRLALALHGTLLQWQERWRALWRGSRLGSRAARWAEHWRRNRPRRPEPQPSPEALRRRFRLVRNDRPVRRPDDAGSPADAGSRGEDPRPPLRLV